MPALFGCEVHSTVGFAETQASFVPGLPCATDSPLSRCLNQVCTVSDVMDVPQGSVSAAVDWESIYFLRSETELGKSSLAGGATESIVTDLDSLMRMTDDASHVYWTELNNRVRAVPKGGGAAFVVAEVFGNPTELALDGEHVYWVLPGIGEVAMAEKPMGEATWLGGQLSPQDIEVDATHVYWINLGSNDTEGELVRAPRALLSGAEVVRSGLNAPLSLTLGVDAIYVASTNTLYRMERPAGEPLVIARGLSEIKAIGAFGNAVYGVGMNGLWRVPESGGAIEVLEPRPMSALVLDCSGVYASGWFDPTFVRYAP